MKILYFGTICELNQYNNMLKKSKKHPSLAPMVFEASVLNGLRQHNIEMDIFSYPMIPNVSKSNIIGWGLKKERIDCGYDVTWIPTINIIGFKQISRWIYVRKILEKWLKQHKEEECIVLLYSICPFIAPNVVTMCKKYHKKCVAIVPDLLSNMYMNQKFGKLKTLLSELYLRPALKIQDQFDGYVYLTDFMKDVINSVSPYIVMEGIIDDSHYLTDSEERTPSKAIMYAGRLHEKYGVKNLIEAYLRIPHNDIELWLFGSGSFESEIEKYTEMESNIKYYGQVEHDKVLEYEKKAYLLVNCRNPKDEYAKYSFPSKTMEYMASGTPVYTTKLPGIPKEYVKYLFTSDSNSVDEIQKVLEMVFDMSEIELNMIGKNAKKFVVEEKNAKKQAEKIIYLLNSVIKE